MLCSDCAGARDGLAIPRISWCLTSPGQWQIQKLLVKERCGATNRHLECWSGEYLKYCLAQNTLSFAARAVAVGALVAALVKQSHLLAAFLQMQRASLTR